MIMIMVKHCMHAELIERVFILNLNQNTVKSWSYYSVFEYTIIKLNLWIYEKHISGSN